MFALLLILLITIIFSQLGWYILHGFGVRDRTGLEEFLFSVTLGLGVLILLVFFLGIAGLLYHWVIWGMLLFIGILTSKRTILLGTHVRQFLRCWSWDSYSRVEKILLGFLSFYGIVYLLLALSPPTHFDGIHYLFPTAQAYIRWHKIHFIPYLFAMRPKNMVMLYVVGYLLHGDILAQLFNYALTAFTAVTVYVTAKHYMQRAFALLAAAIFYSMPLTSMIAGGSLSESGVVLYGFLAFLAFTYWWKTLDIRWIWLAGIFSGFAAGFKVIGVEVALVLGLFTLCRIWKIRTILAVQQPDRSKKLPIRIVSTLGLSATVFIVAVMLFGGYWYYLSYYWTGMPLYNGENIEAMFQRYMVESPSLAHTRDRSIHIEGIKQEVSPSSSEHSLEKVSQKPSLLKYVKEGKKSLFRFGPATLASFAWKMSMGLDFQRHLTSPLYLVFIPLLLLFPSKKNSIALLVSIGLVYFIVGINLWGDYNRYIIPIFPVLAIIVAKVIENISCENKRLGQFSQIVCLSIFLLHCPVIIHAAINHFPAAFGLMKRETYLERHLPGSFPVARYVNENLPESVKLLMFGEFKLYLFERELLVGDSLSLVMRYQHFENSENAYKRLQKFGVTHVILNQQVSNNSGYDDQKKYIEHFKKKYLQLIYQNSQVYLYEMLLESSQN